MSKLIYRDFTTTIVSNTTTETKFFEYLLPKGSLKDDHLLRGVFQCFIQQSTGSDKYIAFRVELSDGTNTTDAQLQNLKPHLGNGDAVLELEVLAENFSAQRVGFAWFNGSEDANSRDENYVHGGNLSTMSLDQSKDVTIKLYVTMDTASVNYDFRIKWAYIELV